MMKSNNFSLKFVVILPFVALIILILSIEAIIWKFDYNFLAEEQGSKIVRALNETTQERLTHLLLQPQNANIVISKEIPSKDLDNESLEELESYLYRVFEAISQSMPQLSSVGYGDEKSRFVGFRFNGDNYSLILKDGRTKENLNIYSGENDQSELIASYENYDPRQRPWYLPVKETPQIQWSEIYVNYDEKMESTITFLAPVVDDDGVFKGVMASDVKLDGINEFLKNDTTKGNGVIYIIDDNFNIIAHSGSEDVMTVIEGDPPTGELMMASNSQNSLIQNSASYFMDTSLEYERVIQQEINGQEHYTLVSKMRSPENLGWSVIVVIPESDLMGEVQQRNQITFAILIVISIFGLAVGLYILNRVTSPIIQSTSVAVAIAKGNWDVKPPTTVHKVKEINALSTAIGTLGNNIKDSFKQIQFNEERYRSLVENVDSMIYSITPDGNFVSVNHTFENNLGVAHNALIGKHFSTIFTKEENVTFWEAYVRSVLREKSKQTVKFEYTNHSDERSIITATLIPMLNDSNEVVMIIGANTDITRLIEAQEEIANLHSQEKERLAQLVEQRTIELERAMSELIDKEKLASLGSLVSGISHEINTPLGVAVSAASLLETKSNQTTEQLITGDITREALVKYMNDVDETSHILSSNLKRASDLVKSFKEIAVNQSVETKLHFNIYDYIQSLLLSLKHEYKAKDHTFEIICNKALELYSYSGAFSQILTNLIMNSLIHGFKDINGGHIVIEIIEHSNAIFLIYKDNGHGMDETTRKRIFEPFYTTNRNKGGSGLGLNIVYNIVTGQLNGKISCESTLNEGTTFIIEIEKE